MSTGIGRGINNKRCWANWLILIGYWAKHTFCFLSTCDYSDFRGETSQTVKISSHLIAICISLCTLFFKVTTWDHLSCIPLMLSLDQRLMFGFYLVVRWRVEFLSSVHLEIKYFWLFLWITHLVFICPDSSIYKLIVNPFCVPIENQS